MNGLSRRGGRNCLLVLCRLHLGSNWEALAARLPATQRQTEAKFRWPGFSCRGFYTTVWGLCCELRPNCAGPVIHPVHTCQPHPRPILRRDRLHVRLCPNREAAGRHREGDRELHPAAQGGGAKVYGAVPVPQGEDAVVQRARGAAVLLLLRLPGHGRRVQLCGQDRERGLSRGGADRGAEVRHSAAQAGVLLAGRGCRCAAADQTAGAARNGRGVV